DVLVLGVDGDIREGIERPGIADARRVRRGRDAVRAEGQGMVTPVLLPGEPPVGRAAADTHEGGRAIQRSWSTRRRIREARLRRPIGASLYVETVEEEEIAREAGRFLGELADENGFGDGRDTDIGRDEGVAPSRGAIPYI